MPKRDILVIGASSGGLEVLTALVGSLPAKLPASVFIVLHVSPHHPSLLPELLSRAGPLRVTHAVDGEGFAPGHIWVAPPDKHLLLAPGQMRLTHGPKENRTRPAVDALFRSAAQAYGPRVVGVVLTGHLDDGAAGLWAIKDRGGLAVVQDPHEAAYPSMPATALKHVAVDHVLPVAKMGAALAKLMGTEVSEEGIPPVAKSMDTENKIAQEENALALGVMGLGPLTPYTCPECNGVLVQLKEGGILRFRCHTGHGYAVDSLLAEVTETVEGALYGAMRGIEEGVLIMKQIAQQLRDENNEAGANHMEGKAAAAEQRADLIHQAIREHKETG
jgi:two-component system, chemotaxis family, protein-glutamate methylesterase/glutaminase